MFSAAALALLAAMALALTRALKGPTLFDRVLAANSFATKTALLIAVFGFLTGRTDFMDLALIYALMNFVGTIAVLKYSRYGTLGQTPDTREQTVTSS